MSTNTLVWLLTISLGVFWILSKREGSIFHKYNFAILLAHAVASLALMFGRNTERILLLLSFPIVAFAIHEAGHAVRYNSTRSKNRRYYRHTVLWSCEGTS